MKKHAVRIILLGLLLLSLTANAVQYVTARKREVGALIGTYCSQTDNPGEGEYYVFLEDHRYVKYRQFQLLEQGTYSKDTRQLDGQGIFKLQSESGEMVAQILQMEDAVYSFQSDGEILSYSKISDTPTFINVEMPEPQAAV